MARQIELKIKVDYSSGFKEYMIREMNSIIQKTKEESKVERIYLVAIITRPQDVVNGKAEFLMAPEFMLALNEVAARDRAVRSVKDLPANYEVVVRTF